MLEETPEPVVLVDDRVAELEAQISSLNEKLLSKQNALETILRELDDLRVRVRAQLED